MIGNSNQFAVGAENAAGSTVLNVSSSSNKIEAADGWTHIMFSCDLSDTGKRHLYINNSSDLATVTTYTNDTMDLTTADFSIGAHCDGSVKLGLDLAEMWISNEYIDLSNSSNRANFYSGGHPVDPGYNGIIPGNPSLGSYGQPMVYLTGSTANWSINRGKGGPFTVHGALTTAATAP